MTLTRCMIHSIVALGLIAFCCASVYGQSPTITSITVPSTKCVYVVGAADAKPCSIGPGMGFVISGQNFGDAAESVSVCDCVDATIERWTSTRIVVMPNVVNPSSLIRVERAGGYWSNSVPYVALAPVISRIDVGTCTYYPNISRKLCAITPGAQVTIHGRFFGSAPGQVSLCDCANNAAVDSWNPNWATDPTPYRNTIVVTAVEVVCGSSVAVESGGMWSNPVPYTTCPD